MAIKTVTRAGTAYKKKFSWSYSRLKNYEVCPKRYYETDVAKNYPQDDGSEVLAWGNAVHKAMAERCGPNKTPLPKGMEKFEPWALKVLGTEGDIFVEQDLAIDEDFFNCGWFDSNTWFRCKVDLARIVGDIGLIVDWKTGKILEDPVQLALTAAVAFAKFPDLRAIRASYVWLKEDAESSENFLREDMPRMWRGMWDRIERLTQAHERMDFPPVQSGMCKSWCKVTKCPFNGKHNT
jgi:hypothetical protein